MTPQRMLDRAVKMFGPKATVSKGKCSHYKAKEGRAPMCGGFSSHPQPCPGGILEYNVGKIVMGLFNEIKGSGLSWKEAFARAEISKHYDECRRCLYRGKVKCKALRLLREKADAIHAEELVRQEIWRSMNQFA